MNDKDRVCSWGFRWIVCLGGLTGLLAGAVIGCGLVDRDDESNEQRPSELIFNDLTLIRSEPRLELAMAFSAQRAMSNSTSTSRHYGQDQATMVPIRSTASPSR